MLVSDAPAAGTPGAAGVMERASSENFPVASRVLPPRVRAHLLAIYGFARLVDELGDSAPGDRLAGLDWIEAELNRAFEGRAEHPLMVRLQPTLRACALSREPFARLIDANRVDQRVSRYESWQQLRGYCALSANPVGEIVLGVLGRATPQRIALSDCICTALQLIEHLQDVMEDVANGRFYIPAEDLARFGLGHDQLASTRAALHDHDALTSLDRLREAVRFEAARARGLLDEGAPLLDQLRGRERLAVAAFIAGGRAALVAIERSGYDVSAGPPRAGLLRRMAALMAVLGDARRRR
jgi:squalene synthase HpnC